MKFYLILFLSILSLTTSCSNYNKVLKSADYDKKFELANEMYDRGKWLQSVALYEQVYQHLPKTSIGEVSYFRIGKAYYYEQDYYMAGYFFGSFFDRFTHSTQTEEAYFYRTVCAVQNSPNYSLDQQETEIALSELQQFIYLFPNSVRVDTCNQMMDGLRLKLEKKDFESLKLYAKTMNYRAAVVAAKTFQAKYPVSKNMEEVQFIKLKNSYLLAINSVESKKKERIEDSIETYRNFVSQFPSSKHVREAETMHDKLQQVLETTTISK